MKTLLDMYGPGKIGPVSTNFPQGEPINVSAPTAQDGMPFEEDWLRDLHGFLQATLAQAGKTASGVNENAVSSQILDSLRALMTPAGHIAGIINIGRPAIEDGGGDTGILSITPVTAAVEIEIDARGSCVSSDPADPFPVYLDASNDTVLNLNRDWETETTNRGGMAAGVLPIEDHFPVGGLTDKTWTKAFPLWLMWNAAGVVEFGLDAPDAHVVPANLLLDANVIAAFGGSAPTHYRRVGFHTIWYTDDISASKRIFSHNFRTHFRDDPDRIYYNPYVHGLVIEHFGHAVLYEYGNGESEVGEVEVFAPPLTTFTGHMWMTTQGAESFDPGIIPRASFRAQPTGLPRVSSSVPRLIGRGNGPQESAFQFFYSDTGLTQEISAYCEIRVDADSKLYWSLGSDYPYGGKFYSGFSASGYIDRRTI